MIIYVHIDIDGIYDGSCWCFEVPPVLPTVESSSASLRSLVLPQKSWEGRILQISWDDPHENFAQKITAPSGNKT